MADPMAEMLKNLKKEVQQKKDSEKASKDFAEGMAGGGTSLKEAFNKTKSPLGAMGKALSSLSGMAAKAMTGLGPIGAVLGGVTGALTAPIDAIQQLVDTVVGFVGLVNPGLVEQFTRALNDAMAVMGEMLTPVLQGLIVYVKAFGDSLAKLEPVLQPLFDAFGQYIANSVAMASDFVEAVAPLVQIFVDSLIPVMEKFQLAMMELNGFMIALLNTVMDLLGLKGDSRINKDATSKGKAVRQTSVQSVDTFAKSVFENSLKGVFGGGQGKRPEDHLPNIAAALEEGKKTWEAIKDDLHDIWDWLRQKKDQINQTKDAVTNAAGSVAGGVIGASPLGQLGKLFL